MRPDSVEVSWDARKRQWLVRIQVGEEVTSRHNDAPQNSDDQALRSAAQTITKDEGYEPDPSRITIRR